MLNPFRFLNTVNSALASQLLQRALERAIRLGDERVGDWHVRGSDGSWKTQNEA